MQKKSVLRLMDANANRALEGLRVCEEVARLYLNNPKLYRQLRLIRHGVAAAMRKLPISRKDLLAARDSRNDIGKKGTSGSIRSLEAMLVINFQRVKEALRALEECSRIIHPQSSPVFQALRFRTYNVERDALLKLAAIRHR